MFTFSFGSAFAMTTVAETKDKHYEIGDFSYKATDFTNGTKGGQGVTAYEVASVTDTLETLAKALTKDGTYTYLLTNTFGAGGANLSTERFHGARLKNVQALVASTLETIKAAKTSYAINSALLALDRKVNDEISREDLIAALKLEDDLTSADDFTVASLVPALDGAGAYILPGYKLFDTDDTDVILAKTKGSRDYNELLGWFFDHGFETVEQITATKKGVQAFSDAAIKISTDKTQSIYRDVTVATTDLTADGLVLYHQAKALKKAIEVADVTNMDATYNVVKAYRDFESANYEDAAYTDDNTTLAAAVAYYGAVNFDKKYDAIQKMSQTEVLAAKADVVALAESILAFEKKFEKKYNEVDVYGSTAQAAKKYNFVTQLGYIEAAGDNTLTDTKLALNVPLPKNLKAADKAAFDAYDAAYTAYKAEFDKAIYEGVTGMDLSEETEAYLLAGKANFDANVKEDTDAAAKLQNYLNNSTLKVTTSALGNTKIRVNARFDAETYKDIMSLCKSNYTITYKFYQKSAKATSFKGPNEKSRNYITYTKISLKKGTKYKFQCGVVIKDKDGKVVAEKSYRASTTGSRVCR